MVFFYHGQTGRNGSVQNDQPTNQRFQPVHGLHCSFIITGEPTVRLVSSVRSDRLKEQALSLSLLAVIGRLLVGVPYLLHRPADVPCSK